MMIAWTGHRPDMFADPSAAQQAVISKSREFLGREQGAEFVCGGQRGVDHWAATAALESGILLHLVLPTDVEQFTAGWPEADQEMLHGLVVHTSTLQIVGTARVNRALAYDLRSELVVRRADRIVAVWTGLRQGGTFYTLCAAAVRGVPIASVLLPPAAAAALRGRGL
ncbi:MAG: hypothetical protein GEU73_17695 [Chloroflexi bacterium]|nr:hypothetical protein [Chloroflexota bacterium]